MITYKNKGIYFGGVFDDEGPRHTIQSSFYNDLYAFDFERKRWYELGVKHATDLTTGKKKRRKQKEKTAENGESSDEDEEEEEEDEEDAQGQESAMLLRQQQENLFGYIDDSGNIVYVNIDDDPEEGPVLTAPAEDGWINVTSTTAPPPGSPVVLEEYIAVDQLSLRDDPPPPLPAPLPTMIETPLPKTLMTESDILRTAFLEEESREAPSHSNPLVQFFNNFTTSPVGRINCQLVTKGCSLFVYGGVTEFGDVEITLDDCWSLDLNKRDKWRPVLRGNMTDLVWKGNDADDQSERTGEGDSDDDDDDDDSDEDDDEEEEEEEADASKKKKKKSAKKEDRSGEATAETEEGGDDQERKARKQKSKSSRAGIRGEMEELRSQLPGGGEDMNRIPLTGAALVAATPSHKSAAATNKKQHQGAVNDLEIESLRDFYRFFS
jgi:hypothetical protein